MWCFKLWLNYDELQSAKQIKSPLVNKYSTLVISQYLNHKVKVIREH